MKSKLAVISVLSVCAGTYVSNAQVTHLDSPNGGPSPALSVDPVGNVGIGTATPQEKMDLRGNLLIRQSYGQNVFTGAPQIDILNDFGKHLGLGLFDNGMGVIQPFEFGVGYSHLALNPQDGNVGIATGVAAPKRKLHVNGDYYGKGQLWLYSANGDGRNGVAYVQARDDSGNTTLNLQFRTQFLGESRDVMMLTADENVGIGTSTPEAKLAVHGKQVIRQALGTSRWEDAAQQRIYGQNSFLDVGVFDSSSAFLQSHRYNFGHQSLVLNPAGGNVGIGTDSPQARLDVAGQINCTTLVLTSDRNQKQDIEPVAPLDTLNKLAQLSISAWAYTNSPNVRHIGPMAQDFKAAFDLGEDDKHIGAGDGIGVALAAIKGLHELVQEKDTEIAALQSELASIKQEMASANTTFTGRLAALEKALSQRNEQQASVLPGAAR